MQSRLSAVAVSPPQHLYPGLGCILPWHLVACQLFTRPELTANISNLEYLSPTDVARCIALKSSGPAWPGAVMETLRPEVRFPPEARMESHFYNSGYVFSAVPQQTDISC